MKTKLALEATIKFISGIIITALILFVPAGTIKYANAWLFMGILFVPMLIFGIILLIKNPELLEKRLQTKEKEKTQKIIVIITIIITLGAFIISGLNYKNQYSIIPTWQVITASIIMLVAYGMYIEVMRENTYISRIIEIQKNQKVIDTGLYKIVRHPMYLSAIILFLAMPIVLGSYQAFIIMLAYPALLITRIQNEEKLLEKELKGYKEYKEKVKYKLIPYIW